jgi:hypothetical protein
MRIQMDQILMLATLGSVLPYVAVAVGEWVIGRVSAHCCGAHAPER